MVSEYDQKITFGLGFYTGFFLLPKLVYRASVRSCVSPKIVANVSSPKQLHLATSNFAGIYFTLCTGYRQMVHMTMTRTSRSKIKR